MPGTEEWIRVLSLLESKGVKKLYHYTDKENIALIRTCGGLLSLRSLSERSVTPPRAGGDKVSHMIDSANHTDNYVHLCFSPRQYSLDAALKSGRIKNPRILEVSLEALRAGNPVYSVLNSASTHDDAIVSSGIQALSRIHIETAVREDLDSIPLADRRFHQAEVLIENQVPLKYLINFDSLIEATNPRLVVFVVDHSRSTSQRTTLDGKEIPYMYNAISRIVNEQIYSLMKSCIGEDGISNRYEFAVIGYGDDAYNAWQPELGSNDFYTPDKLYDFLKKDKPSFMTNDDYFEEMAESLWVPPKHSGWKTRTDRAFAKTKKLINTWISFQDAEYDPPIVIHITDGDFNGGLEVDQARSIAEDIMSISTKNGHASVWNFHVCSRNGTPVILPDIMDAGKMEENVRRLYEFSSDIPSSKNHLIESMFGMESTFPRKAMAVNSDMDTLRKLVKLACS